MPNPYLICFFLLLLSLSKRFAQKCILFICQNLSSVNDYPLKRSNVSHMEFFLQRHGPGKQQRHVHNMHKATFATWRDSSALQNHLKKIHPEKFQEFLEVSSAAKAKKKPAEKRLQIRLVAASLRSKLGWKIVFHKMLTLSANNWMTQLWISWQNLGSPSEWWGLSHLIAC